MPVLPNFIADIDVNAANVILAYSGVEGFYYFFSSRLVA